jgi:hypothetical protein
MFKKVKPNLVESDEGFSVEVLPGMAGGLIYREGQKSMRFYSEIIAHPRGISITINRHLVWEPPIEKEEIDREKREDIIDNLKHVFDFWGVEVEFIESRE